MPIPLKSLVETCSECVMEAGHLLIRFFCTPIVTDTVKEKDPHSLATKIDQDAENLIVSIIKSRFPGHRILAEENHADLDKADPDIPLWIIDPLDGTHNYIKGIPLFGVSVGVLYKGEYVAGSVYMPVEDELYTAEYGSGAWKNHERIRVSPVDNLKKASVCFDSSFYQDPDKMTKTLSDLSTEVFNVRIFGTTVRTLTYLAEGKIDAAVEYYDMPWDFAGSVPIIREAGAMICDISGKDFTPESRGYLAAAPGIFHEIRSLIL